VIPQRLSVADNYDHFFEGAPVCPDCNLVTDPEWVSPTFRLGKRRPDACATRDGAVLVSQQFVDAVEGMPGARFIPLPADPTLYRMVIDQLMLVDEFRCHPRSCEWCATCGRWTQVHGTIEWFVGEDSMPLGFSRGSTEYAGAAAFATATSSTELVHPESAAVIRKAHLRGVHFSPVRKASEEWVDPLTEHMRQLYRISTRVWVWGPEVDGERVGGYAQHTVSAPASPETVAWLPSSLHATFLCIADGITMFDAADPADPSLRSGLRIFSTTEIEKQRAFLRSTLRAAAQRYPDEFNELQEGASVDLLEWYDGLVPVAVAVGGSDLIVADPSVRDVNDEPEIVMLDHELFYGSPIDDAAVVHRWAHFAEFLDDVRRNHERFISPWS
jgi:hypothetical protein